MTAPETKTESASSHVLAGLEIVGRIRRAGSDEFVRVDALGNADERAVLGVWVPPLSWRIGRAIAGYLERVERFSTRYSGVLLVMTHLLVVGVMLFTLWLLLTEGLR